MSRRPLDELLTPPQLFVSETTRRAMASLSPDWLPCDYAMVEAQAAAAALVAAEMNCVRALIALLCLTLEFPVVFLHDEMIFELPTSPTGRSTR